MTAPAPDVQPAADVAAAERLVFFSDAVVAIAITLLALNLPLPRGATNAQVWQSLRGHGDDYLAFLISFVVVGTHWRVHHSVFRYVARLGGQVGASNMIWLLMIVVTPFATRVLTGNGGAGVRLAVYAVVQLIAWLALLQMTGRITRDDQLREDTPPGAIAGSQRRAAAMCAAFLVSIPLAFVTHWAFLCWIAPQLAWRASHRLAALRSGLAAPR
ncbi:MAG: DUF1211 domain-containing protein [Actinobacteria bacterium]|nr:DUF1211 domain-containing protein [Actinomycetota bacterium]